MTALSQALADWVVRVNDQFAEVGIRTLLRLRTTPIRRVSVDLVRLCGQN
jgi:hypothetical protein